MVPFVRRQDDGGFGGGGTPHPTLLCPHCGQPSFNGRFCCPGCEAAYDIIQTMGLGGYYARRLLDPTQRALKPDPEAAADLTRHITTAPDGTHTLTLAVDGTDLQENRKMLELEIDLEQHHAEAEAKVFECAGGYAPTVGIIGAVIGLIQVMKELANIDEVGHGIAVAFVATVYGVGLANLLLLPAANKMKARQHAETQRKEMILEGVSGIVEGLNPKLIRTKLECYSQEARAKEKKKLERGSAAPVSAEV